MTSKGNIIYWPIWFQQDHYLNAIQKRKTF